MHLRLPDEVSPILKNVQSLLLRAVSRTERAVSPAAPPLSDLRNFLFLEHSLALGTAIHGTPLVGVLKAVLPDARVVAAASGSGLGVLKNNPALERLVSMPSPLTDLRGAVRVLRSTPLFAGEPFAVLQSTGNLRTRVAAAAALGGGRIRVGFSVHPELVRAPLTFDGELSQIANNLRLVTALGHGQRLAEVLSASPSLAEPAVFPDSDDYAHVRELLQAEHWDVASPVAVLITQTSATQRKGWRPERFRRAAEMLGREYGASLVFGGTASEAQAIDELRRGLKVRSVNLAGRTSLLQMAALFGIADVALTLDTGPMHLARAMQTPTVIIAPAWSPPVEWLPVDNARARILKNLTLPTAPADYIIDEVSVDDVEEALRELLTRFPPRHTAMQG